MRVAHHPARQVTDSMGRRERKTVSTYNETRSFHELLVGTGLTRGDKKKAGSRRVLPKALRCERDTQVLPWPCLPPGRQHRCAHHVRALVCMWHV
jgi:hypothetical protein